MLKLNAMIAAGVIGVSAGALAAGQAGTAERMYMYTYYSDASKTQTVGFAQDICYGTYTMLGPASGQVTAHFDREWIGMCPGYLF